MQDIVIQKWSDWQSKNRKFELQQNLSLVRKHSKTQGKNKSGNGTGTVTTGNDGYSHGLG
jgi:hypothetical protein